MQRQKGADVSPKEDANEVLHRKIPQATKIKAFTCSTKNLKSFMKDFIILVGFEVLDFLGNPI